MACVLVNIIYLIIVAGPIASKPGISFSSSSFGFGATPATAIEIPVVAPGTVPIAGFTFVAPGAPPVTSFISLSVIFSLTLF